ncbi:putative phenylacetyl-CoA ligase [Pseudomassariella vexata]|uniref:Putative phenylacetyl-CoA ligase n=1 Tax=Pseudomassariella vexata TaxID=1141098 RepID=A0A1Y2E5Z0_9PEZI|nr:putative phenylacetyl-CoA ligase [Pseudomassariella vexata]ORY66285.1 putative phenylacetyl-CoA ligase [Pseudomassariella vexata]
MVIKSPHPDLTITPVDLFTLLFERDDRPYPEDKELFIDGDTGRSYNFTQLKNTSIEFGKGLKSQWGFRKGDILGIFSPNSVDYPPVVWGAIWAGGICSTANPTYTVKELAFQMLDSKAKGIVTQLPMLPVVLEAAKEIGMPEDRIILMGHERDPKGKFKHFSDIRSTSFLSLSSKASIEPSKDLAFLVYSSGTTGLPKGVMLTHTNIVSNILQTVAVEARSGLHWSGGPDGKGDKQLGILPFFHIYGLTAMVHCTVLEGFQVIVMPKFELERACQLIQKYGITFAYIPPPIILGLAKHPVVDKYDLTSLKWLNSGAAPLTQELQDSVWERLTIPTKQGYGLSETSPTTHLQTVLEWAKHKASVGKLVPNMEAKIVDLEGNELPVGQEGELWVKGPNVFQGYYNRPELADETFSKCGFFKTGDIGYVDDKGNFYITDRLKELIKYKGFQVAPAELEGILLGHGDIIDACVIPIFDNERSTEVPRACVVLKPGTARTEEKAKEIVDWLATKVAPHKQLRGGVCFVDEVPKNASGKILRRVLREQAKVEDRAKGPKL